MTDRALEIALELVGEQPSRMGRGYSVPCPVQAHENGEAVIYNTADGGVICYCQQCGPRAPWHELKKRGLITSAAAKFKIQKDTCSREVIDTLIYRDADNNDYMQAQIADYFNASLEYVGRDISYFNMKGGRVAPSLPGIFLDLWMVREGGAQGYPIIEAQDEIAVWNLHTLGVVTCFPFNHSNLHKWCASKPWDQVQGCEYVAIVPNTGRHNLDMAKRKADHYYKNGISAKVIDLASILGDGVPADLGPYEIVANGKANDLLDLIKSAPIYLPPVNQPLPEDIIELYPAEAERVLSEKAVAEAVDKHLNRRALFVAEKKDWYLHNGQVYDVDKLGSRTFLHVADYLDRELPAKIRAARVPEQDQRRAIAAFKEKAKVNNVFAFLRAACTVSVDEFDADPLVINTRNKVLDLNSGDIKVRDHAPGDRCLKMAGFSFNPKARCKKWREFQKWIFEGDEERMAFNQFWAGYCLLGLTGHQIVRMNKGKGSNGKSLDSNVRMAIGGSYGAPVMSRIFLKRQFDTQLDSLSQLLGVRHGVVSELPANARLDDATIKDLSGGDVLKVRFLREEPQDMIVQVKLEFRTNFEPDASTDDGLHRRLRMVPYRNKATDDMKIPDLDKQFLAEERDGIGYWALEGALMLLDQKGFPVSKEIDSESSIFRKDNDKVAQFVDCWVRKDTPPNRSIRQSDAYAYYSAWCKDEGITFVLSPGNFGKELERLGFKRGTSKGYTTIKGFAVLNEVMSLVDVKEKEVRDD